MSQPDAHLDRKGLGRLRRVPNTREVWVNEAGDLTPWLADNIDVLAEELGMTLTIIGTEVTFGDGFRVDIRAEDGDGKVVVIENQLERTDHDHLGKCLVYASGLDASTVVWVSPSFRDDFRRALDWLNERTDVGIRFFGVELGVVQIGNGPRAPVFDVVARPNDWQKTVKSAGTSRELSSGLSVVNAKRQDLFVAVLTEVIAKQPVIRMPARGTKQWLSFSSGPFGHWALAIVGPGGKTLRVEAYLDAGNEATNKQLLDEFEADRERWNNMVGRPLDYQRLDGKRASRIAVDRLFDIDDAQSRQAAHDWAVSTLLAMFRALNEPLRRRAAEIKRSVALS